jgi:prephenate dehydratase
VRAVAEHNGSWAALGNRLAAELYHCRVLMDGVQDLPDNETRFVWLGRVGSAPGLPGANPSPDAGWKTAIVFWGAGSDQPGWLVSCLSALASQRVNLTRIESRPRKQSLGAYMFFADLEGGASAPAVAAGLAGLRKHVQVLRVLGSFPAA